jgi:hypothetical protein
MKNKVSDIVDSKENLSEIFRFFLIYFMLILLVIIGICKLNKRIQVWSTLNSSHKYMPYEGHCDHNSSHGSQGIPCLVYQSSSASVDNSIAHSYDVSVPTREHNIVYVPHTENLLPINGFLN